MRLLFFIYSLSGGGAERVTGNLANHWAAKGWDITIVTLTPLSLDFYELHPKIRRIALDLAGESRNFLVGFWKVATCEGTSSGIATDTSRHRPRIDEHRERDSRAG